MFSGSATAQSKPAAQPMDKKVQTRHYYNGKAAGDLDRYRNARLEKLQRKIKKYSKDHTE